MDYGILMCEDLMEAGFLGQRSAAIGAGVGAGVGAAGSTAVWAKKRLSLNKKLKACGDDKCRQAVKAEIKNLRGKAVKYGAAATVAGAGVGAAAGYGKARHTMKKSGDAAKAAYKAGDWKTGLQKSAKVVKASR